MSQTYPLDRVIRIVESGQPSNSPAEQIVVIDNESRQAIEIVDAKGRTQLERIGLLRRAFIERKYFLVANNSDIRNEAEGRVSTFSLRDFARKWTLGLDVSYLASCRPGNEAKVAEALCVGSHPGAVLNDLVTRWLKEFAGADPGDLIENYYSRKTELEDYIAAKALDEAGMNLKVVVRLPSEREALEPIRIRALHFPVRAKDGEEEEPLKLEAEVQVDPQRKIYAVLYRSQSDRVEELIRTRTREFFAANVSLHKFHSELRSSGLKAELTSYLDAVLRPFGRKIGFISLTERDVKPPEGFFEARKVVEFDDIQEYEEKVAIKNIVQMNLQDYGLYKNAGSKDLNIWIEENLTEVIKQVLFGKRYIDLLIKFEPLEREIKDKLSVRAEAIGYSIKQLITVPDLEPYDWKENFTLEVEDEFETNTPKFPVKLAIFVTARIPRLQDIETFLNRRQNVPRLMKDAIINETRLQLHKVDPERFYMHFSYAEPEDTEKAVDEILRELIETKLAEKFKADVISIVFKVLDTEITDVWSKLEKSEGSLEIKLPSFSDVEGVTYRGRIRVEAIHSKGWTRFRTSNPDIERICRRLEEHVLARLGSFANADLVYTNIEAQRQVEQIIEGLAKKFAVEEFGVVIRVTSIRRDVTPIELEAKLGIQQILNALKQLEEQRLSEIIAGGNPERIKAIEDRITILEADLPGSVKTTRIKFTRPELIEPAAPTRLADIAVGRKSIGAGTRARGNNHHEGSE
jgi:hypothetical protein